MGGGLEWYSTLFDATQEMYPTNAIITDCFLREKMKKKTGTISVETGFVAGKGSGEPIRYQVKSPTEQYGDREQGIPGFGLSGCDGIFGFFKEKTRES